MLTTLSILIIVVCVFMVIIVLVQNSKGGGLAQNFASTQQVMGVRKTTDFLEKATWTCAIAIMLLSFVSVAMLPSTKGNAGAAQQSVVDDLLNNQSQQTTTSPSFATPSNDATEAAPAAEPVPDAGAAPVE